jgi:hypothetical protein
VEEVLGASPITSFAGLPLVAEAFRACGADRAVACGPPTRVRHRDRGLTDGQMAESFCLLLAAGGEHIDDFQILRDDEGLAELVGYEPPSPTRAKEYLYAFDEGMELPGAERAQQDLFGGKVAQEQGPIEGLAAAERATLRAAQLEQPCREATIDLDASIVESEKQQAALTYTGESGYQPTLAYWAEQQMVLYEEFRDGNVPAGKDILRVLKRAVQALPEGVEKKNFRSDSAAYDHDVLNWCREQADITFAISADMSPELRAAITALAEQSWSPLDRTPRYMKMWAEVEFIPSAPSCKKGRRPDRYLAIKIEPRQGRLFRDGSEVKYFAVVTNDWERGGAELIRWHRQKAGTIEKLHDVLKNGLGAGVMPCGRFGANAAWLRLNVLCYNLLTIIRRHGLEEEQLRRARPKTLRLWVLCRAGRLVHHARALVVRVSWRVRHLMGRIASIRLKLFQLAWQVSSQPRARPSPQPA